ncbi:class I SAM-dependent methyltransferase [Opitutus terrae]|uniref:Methyltransferase type 11 n=1 Tax=Opitutus terrae (strain DSM 11246 / JCM 15787 / PB90-1) TaxID=452637 RepID=B1ZNM1_OPITP|nr:class I SAM-dependent methyltransferase [Opitutus terrae]ACB74455.1 Methyltransferase type 11 [Opitutus terrae PB90-1]
MNAPTPPKFQDLFSGVAAHYATFRPHYPAALFDLLATLEARDTTVWDCACGNGQASVELARRFARVVATDASVEQITSAARLPNIDYRVALAEDSRLAERSTGLVTVAQALHWFDLPRFYAEVKRVLQPGGLLAVWCYGINEIEGGEVNGLVQEFYGGVLGPYWPRSRELVEAGYRTLPFPFAELPAPTLRMEAHWTLEQLLGYFSTWSARTRYVEARGQDPLIPFAAELAQVWGKPQARRTITWPLGVRLGRIAR